MVKMQFATHFKKGDSTVKRFAAFGCLYLLHTSLRFEETSLSGGTAMYLSVGTTQYIHRNPHLYNYIPGSDNYTFE